MLKKPSPHSPPTNYVLLFTLILALATNRKNNFDIVINQLFSTNLLAP